MTLIRGTLFLLLLAVIVGGPAEARGALSVSSLTVSPTSVEAGQTITVAVTITSTRYLSDYPLQFSWFQLGAGKSTATTGIVYVTLQANDPTTETYVTTVPADTAAGTYTLDVGSRYQVYASTTFTISTGTTTGSTTANLSASPTSITSGQSSTLTWGSTNAASCTGTGFTASGTSGSVTVSPTQTTTYSVTCAGSGSTSSPASATVTVSAQNSNLRVAFTPLHTYYMSPTGSDSNSGTSPLSPWATPSHIGLVCGDVIVAAPGSYSSSGYDISDSPSGCPSTSGGIDGNGGVEFVTLVCGGTDLGTAGSGCYLPMENGAGNVGIDITANHWAVEGWTCKGGGASTRCFQTDTCSSKVSYQAFVNDVAYDAADGVNTNGGCGPQGTTGADYWAAIGDIAQNAAQDSICLAAIDDVQPAALDSNAGPHVLVYGNFSYANANAGCRSISDTEDFMFDTFDPVSYLSAFVNNVGFDADRFCFQILDGGSSGSFDVYNDTCFQNNTHTGGDYDDGEINLQTGGTAVAWNAAFGNNIAYQPLAASSGGSAVAGFVLGEAIKSGAAYANGTSSDENVYRANNSSCTATYCNSTFDNGTFGAQTTLGTNTYENPAFEDTADLLSNRLGAPNCAGSQTTVECMGYNASTNTLTIPSGASCPGGFGCSTIGSTGTPIIYDLMPTASGTSGKGYQVPSLTCLTSGQFYNDYPTWLKGVVYLHWDGTNLWEYNDLVTKPCGT